jgi:HEAT repeat protein
MALGITDAPGALADLHSIFLVDEDPDVRRNAVFAMSQLDNPEAARILEDIIRQPRYGELRRAALFWLAQMDSGEASIDAIMRDIL